MRDYIKRIIIISLVLAFGLAACVNVFAEEQTAQIFNLEEKSNMMVTVEYTNGAPAVKFIAPNGDEFGNDAIAQGLMRVQDDGSALTYWIPNARAGQWQIVYDKGANPKLNIVWAPYAEVISIKTFDFSLDPDRADRLNVKLGASYVSDSNFEYIIYAAITDSNGSVEGTKELKRGTLTANHEPADITVNIGNLSTFDNYKLMAEVFVKTGSYTVSDSRISDKTFTFENTKAYPAIENVYTEVCLDDEYLKLDWGKYKVSAEKYMVAIYLDSNSEAFYFSEFDQSITSTELLLDTKASNVKIQLGYIPRNSDMSANLLTKEIDLSMASAVTIQGSDASSDSYVKIDYDFSHVGDKVKTVVSVNASKQESMLSDKGVMSARLDMFDNDVSVYWYLDDNTAFVAHRAIYYDNIAPVLVLPEISSVVKTATPKYVLVGYTDPGCTVTVNGTQAEVDESGSFKIAIDLTEGNNTVSVVAMNSLGNSSTQNFSIIYSGNGIVGNIDTDTQNTDKPDSPFISFFKRYYPMICALLAGILLIGLVFICRRVGSRIIHKSGLASAVLWIIGIVFLYCSIIAGGFMGVSIYKYKVSYDLLYSMDFYDTAKTSVTRSYELIMDHEELKARMILTIWVFGILAVLSMLGFVLSFVLPKIFRKKPPLLPDEKVPVNVTNDIAGMDSVPLPVTNEPSVPETHIADVQPQNIELQDDASASESFNKNE